MGKYPRFKVIDPYNTQTEKNPKNCENFSASQNMNMELLAAGHTQTLFLLIYLTFPDKPL